MKIIFFINFRFWLQESSEESSSEEENTIDPRGVSSEESVEDNDIRFFKSFEDQELIHQLELINLLIASQRRHNDLADINPQDKNNLIRLGNRFLAPKDQQTKEKPTKRPASYSNLFIPLSN